MSLLVNLAAEEGAERSARNDTLPQKLAPGKNGAVTNCPDPARSQSGVSDAQEKEKARAEWQKRREEWEKLSPEERHAKIKEWRQKQATNSPVTEAEKQLRRKQLRERLEQQLLELREKKTNGTLNAEEKNRLARLEELAQRAQSGKPRPEKPQEPTPAKSRGTQ